MEISRTTARASRACVLATTVLITTVAAAADAPNYSPSKEDAYLAANHPDQFAWKVFVGISSPANNGTRDTIWETWPSETDLYKDPHFTPTWPSDAPRDMVLTESTQHVQRDSERRIAASLPPLPRTHASVSSEDVRDNFEAFSYIVDNNLWYREGLIEAVRDKELNFPYGSIALKGKWTPIDEKDKDRYHWQVYRKPDSDEKEYVGLVALHITTRALPTWHWATFEHVDNPGLADYIGVHDSFGLVPKDIWPNRELNQGYNKPGPGGVSMAGVLTEPVRKMMDKAGITGALAENYRLKGSQIAFTDRTGRPTILGNSVTEAGFVSNSSCIACHARATVGAPYQGQHNVVPPPPLSVFDERGQSVSGSPDPTGFWDQTASLGTPPAQPEAFRRQVEFLWQLAFGPKYRVKPKTPTVNQ